MPVVALFVSDLHLSGERPEIARTFLDFLRGPARETRTLYILGDLFDYWAGDDDLGDPFNAAVVAALADCARSGVEVALMHGNRDFLLGPKFADAARLRLIADPHRIALGGAATLLMHGDTLCTDDQDYQRFRSEVRNPAWQERLLALPLGERKRRIEALRRRSESEKRNKSEQLMDVNPDAVAAVLREYDCTRLIHGHTHHPGHHRLEVDGRICERWVLGDWYRAGSYLRYDERGLEPVALG